MLYPSPRLDGPTWYRSGPYKVGKNDPKLVPSVWDLDMQTMVERLFERGNSYAQVARKVGTTVANLRSVIARYGLYADPSHWLDVPAIAAIIGVSPQVARSWVAQSIIRGEKRKRGKNRLGYRAPHRFAVPAKHFLEFLADERYWPLWSVDAITDRDWAEKARSIRGDRGRYLNVAQTASMLNSSVSRVNQWCFDGLLPSTLAAHRRYIRIEDAAAFRAPSEDAYTIRRFTDAETQTIIAMRLAGKAPNAISVAVGGSGSTIVRWMRRYHPELLPREEDIGKHTQRPRKDAV